MKKITIENATNVVKCQFKCLMPSVFVAQDKIDDIEMFLREMPGKLYFCKLPKLPQDEYHSYDFDVANTDENTNDLELDAMLRKFHQTAAANASTSNGNAVEQEYDDDEDAELIGELIESQDVTMIDPNAKNIFQSIPKNLSLSKKQKIKK